MEPLVSVIIPVYNGANYVAEAIESALNQTYRNIEIIVVNDGSNDNGATEQVVSRYIDRIRYFKKANGGVSSALNLGIRNMRGQYFSWLSHDDKYTPDKVEKQIALLAEYDFRDDIVALCASRHMDKYSKPYGKSSCSFRHGQLVGPETALQELFREGSFNGCALMIPRAVFDRCGLFHEGLRFCQDYLMWIEIFLHRCSLVYSQDVCVYNRIHSAQVTQTRRDLFHKDSNELCSIILERVAEASTKELNLLLDYTINSAKYDNRQVVRACLEVGEKRGLFSKVQKLRVKCVLAYGRIRPWLRKVYYKVVKRVEVQ